jgi:predicted transcriptional regulator
MKREAALIKTRFKQVQIAKKTGVTQPTVSNWLKMNSRPTGLAKTALQTHYPELHDRIEEAWVQK